MRRRSIHVAALAALAVSSFLAAAPRADEDAPTGDAVLDGADVRELLAILESETFRAEAYEDLRTEALKQLSRVVKQGGEPLRDAALRRIASASGDARRRAELVL